MHRRDRRGTGRRRSRERLPAVLREQERARQEQRERARPSAPRGTRRPARRAGSRRSRRPRRAGRSRSSAASTAARFPSRVVRSPPRRRRRGRPAVAARRAAIAVASSRAATARPIPPAAPVTIATRSGREEVGDKRPGLGRVEDPEVRGAEDRRRSAPWPVRSTFAPRPSQLGAPREVVRRARAVLGRDTGANTPSLRGEVDEARVRVADREVARSAPASRSRFSALRNGVSAAPYSRQTALSGVKPPSAGSWK